MKSKPFLESVPTEVEWEGLSKRFRWQFYFLVGINIVCMAAVLLIQEWLRPKQIFPSANGQFLMGTLPSFLAGLGYTCMGFALHQVWRWRQQGRNWRRVLLLAAGLTVAGLTLWEWIRSWLHSFDWWDVAMSATGAACAIMFVAAYQWATKSLGEN